MRKAGTIFFLLLSVFLGLAAGGGAVLFRGLIAFFHNAFFLGRLSWAYDAAVHTPASPWGAAVVLVPAAASFVVTLLVTRFAPEARGHGVPEVMEAIFHRKGEIRPVVAVVKALASALSIGSGGSVGREGPIAQIGSALGSAFGGFLALSEGQRVTLVAAGAAAGIAATFNTPIGGALFAVELMLPEVSASTLVPVILASSAAAFLGRLAFGSAPSFLVSGLAEALPVRCGLALLALYAGLGVVLAGACVVYIKALYLAEDLFQRIPGPYLRHAAGMAMVGASMYLLLVRFGHYYIAGVGYAAIQDILSGRLEVIWILLLLAALKILATSVTLGSGASGGIFAPALFIGSTLGAAYALAARALGPSLPIDPRAFAIAGMAGLVAGSTGAAMTAIVMTLEMTLDYQMALPMAVTVALSYGLRKLVLADSIYTMKLTRRGRAVPQGLRARIGSSSTGERN